VCNHAKSEPPMKNGGNVRLGHWHQSIVDLLIVASTVVVLFATTAATANVRDLLILGAGALIAIALMFEPTTTAAQAAHDAGAQPPAGPNPGSVQWRDGFDATAAASL
jgi:hypothetical protein